MGDRRFEDLGRSKNLVVLAMATCPAIDGDLLAGIDDGRDLVQIRIGGTYDRLAGMYRVRHIVLGVGMRDVDRNDQDCHTALRDCRLAGHDGLAAGLFGGQDHVAIDADAPVYRLEVDLLRKLEPQFVANDLAGDQNDGRAITVRLDDAIDKMQAAGTAASGDRGEVAGDQGFAVGGEGPSLFVAYSHPLDRAFGDAVCDPVEGIAYDAVTMLDARALQRFDDDICDLLAHGNEPLWHSCRNMGPAVRLG